MQQVIVELFLFYFFDCEPPVVLTRSFAHSKVPEHV